MVGWLKLFNLLAFNQLDLKQILPTCVQHIHFSLTVFWDFYSISFLDNQRLSMIQETSPFGFKKNRTNNEFSFRIIQFHIHSLWEETILKL